MVRAALNSLQLPVHAITGDHDKTTGALHLFQRYLKPELYRGVGIQQFRLFFLSAMDGATPRSFNFRSKQIAWVEQQLTGAQAAGLRPLVFTQLYPSELEIQGAEFSRAIRKAGVELVELGHTRYNASKEQGPRNQQQFMRSGAARALVMSIVMAHSLRLLLIRL